MIELKLTALRNTLDFYSDSLNTVIKIYFDLGTYHTVNATPKQFNETIGNSLQVNNASLVDEIRLNLMGLGDEERARYFSYINKYFSDFADHLTHATNPIKDFLFLQGFSFDNTTKQFNNPEIDYEKGKVRSSVRKQIEYGNLAYFLSCLYIAWQDLQQAIMKESGFKLKEENATEEGTTKEITTKQCILLLEKIGFFDLPVFAHVDLTKVRDVVAPLIGKNPKNVYDVIRERKSLGKNKRDLKRVTELLDPLSPGQ